jgi:DNA-binding NarL/FixJ family response regulator
MEKIEILLVDDNAMIRAAIKLLLDRLEDVAVVGEASNIAETLDELRCRMPTVVVTDLSVGLDNGLDLVRTLKQQVPEIATVVLSTHASEALIAEALKLGASAYVLKEDAPEEMEIAIRAAARGEIYLSASVSKQMIKWFARSPGSVRPIL